MTTKKTPLDLASLDTVSACDKGFELELKHPITKEGLGQFISVVGRDSTVYLEHNRSRINNRIRQNALNQKNGEDNEILTVEVQERDLIETLVVCTTGWRDVNYKGDLTYNTTNVRKLYTELLFARRQVDEAISKLENFMKA